MTTCDRIAVLDEGVIQQVGTPVQLYDQPVNRFVANFVGTINLFEGEVLSANHEHGPQFISPYLGNMPVSVGTNAAIRGKAHLAIRPHSLFLAEVAAATAADHVSFDADVLETEFLGEFVRYRIATGHAEWIADQPHRVGAHLFPIGGRVKLMISLRDTRILPP